jgi:hypothetical protein
MGVQPDVVCVLNEEGPSRGRRDLTHSRAVQTSLQRLMVTSLTMAFLAFVDDS